MDSDSELPQNIYLSLRVSDVADEHGGGSLMS